DELDPVTVLGRLRRRARVGVQVDRAVLLGHLRDRVGHAGVDGPDEEVALLAGDEALGHARAGRGRRLGVLVDVGDLPPEDPALRVALLDGHDDAAHVGAAAVAVLAAVVAGEADLDGPVGLLRVDAVHAPGAEERGPASDGGDRPDETAAGNGALG